MSKRSRSAAIWRAVQATIDSFVRLRRKPRRMIPFMEVLEVRALLSAQFVPAAQQWEAMLSSDPRGLVAGHSTNSSALVNGLAHTKTHVSSNTKTSDVAQPTFVVEGAASDDNSGGNVLYTPAQVRDAYEINQLSFGAVAGDGRGQTIAVIEAYNDPNIVADANTFNATFNLPAFTIAGDGPTLTVENQYGSTNPANLPANGSPGDWDIEESLDVEWAHTVAPGANIDVFEANSQNFSDMMQAVDAARNTPGVSVVSMSFGYNESYSADNADIHFTTPSTHAGGVAFVASTGDDGAIYEEGNNYGGYPAFSPNVLAVGGTSLTINGDGSYQSESGWIGSGGGVSQTETEPPYQNAVQSTGSRTIPDVSWLADPSTGVPVVDTYFGAQSGVNWLQVGGTSLAAPMWAGLISIVDQGLALR